MAEGEQDGRRGRLLYGQGETITSLAERRQLTVVFVDIVDSTSLSTRLDPEEFFAILSAYHAFCNQQIRSFGGNIARPVGDGVLAYFGLPAAHEDDCERAVQAALSIAAAMRERQFETREAGSLRLKVRVAVNTGIVVVGRMTGEADHDRREVFGMPVHLAARLQNVAPPDGVVIGATTHELVHKAFKCASLGQHKFKGVSHSVAVWLVEGAADSESRFAKTRPAPLSAMVGRVSEHAKLLELWDGASSGSGSAVVVSGDPGVGKSRLIHEFRATLPAEAVEILYLQCSPLHTNTPLAPEIERLRRAAHLNDGDAPAQRVAKLRAMLALAVQDAESALPYYGALLSLPACEGFTPADLTSPREREQALQTLTRTLMARSRARPLLMIIEDIQWIDPTSLELGKRIVSRVASERMLLVVTHRSDSSPPPLSGSAVVTLPLAKLSDQESERLLETIVGTASLPGWMLRKIVERTDGVPLFIEAVAQTILESGVLPIGENRRLVGSSLSELLLPTSLKDFLTERLDNLGQAKRLAQVASVFGRQFEFDDLLFLSGVPPKALLEGLSQLEAAGVLRRQMRPSGATYAFRHAMIEEAAYASMLKEERRDLHARAASRLSALGPNHDSSQLALLAHHYSRAGMLSEAIGAWLAAGHAAMQRSAYREVIANLSEGVELVSELPESSERSKMEITLHSHLGMAYAALGGWWHPRADRAYGRALHLSRTLGSVREKSIVLWGMTIAKLVSCELLKAHEYAQEFRELANASRDSEVELMAHTGALLVNFFLGRLREAQAAGNSVIERYSPGDHSKLVQIYQHDPNIVALVYASRIEWLLGNPNGALNCSEKAQQLARELNHPFMLAFALILGSSYHLLEGNHAANLACVEEGLAIAKEYTLPLYEVFGPLWAIPALANRDPGPAILEELSNRLNKLLDNKYYLQAALYQSHLAIEFSRIGAADKAHALAKSAETITTQTGERWFEPEMHRIRAVLLSRDAEPDSSEPMQYFQRALESARSIGAVGWELRAATGLANFLHARAKPREALGVLADARGKFSAEQSTADLRQADLLLDVLRAAT
jgi:class 3 adenylate cyclase/predicted ATPase